MHLKDKDLIIKDFKAGMPVTKLAEKYGVNYKTLSNYLVDWGVKSAPKTEIDDSKDWVISKYKEGKISVERMAKQLGVKPCSVSNALRAWGVPRNRGFFREKSVVIKTNKDKIIDLYKSGWTSAKIAKKFGLADCTVQLKLKEWGVPARSYVKVDPLLVEKKLIQGFSIEEIADQLGVMPSAVYKTRVNKLGISSSNRVELSKLDANMVKRLYAFHGLNVAQIFRVMKKRKMLKNVLSDAVIRRFVTENSLKQAKISDVSLDDLNNILGLSNSGLSPLEISDSLFIPVDVVVANLVKFKKRTPGRISKENEDGFVEVVKDMRSKGLSSTVISNATGLTRSQISGLVKKFNIGGGGKIYKYSKRELDALADKIRVLRREKLTVNEIAAKLKVSSATVGRVIRDYSIPGSNKVFDDDVKRKIKDLFLKDVHYVDIAKRLGLKSESVRQEISRMGFSRRDKPWNIKHQVYSEEEQRVQNEFFRKYYLAPYFFSIKSLSDKSGLDKTTIKNRLKKMGIRIRGGDEAKALRSVRAHNVRIPASEREVLFRRRNLLKRHFKKERIELK